MTRTCPECGAEHETIDDFETESVQEFEVEEDGSFSLHENKDLFLCKGCREPMGVGRSQ